MAENCSLDYSVIRHKIGGGGGGGGGNAWGGDGAPFQNTQECFGCEKETILWLNLRRLIYTYLGTSGRGILILK